MKLSRQDLRIIMAIRKEGRPMTNYELTSSLKIKSPAQTHKRLSILEREHVINGIDGYPKFYTFNSKNAAHNFIILTVECPKCQAVHVIHHTQLTVQCFCTTDSGKKTRFYVFQDRIKDMRSLSKNGHELKKDPDFKSTKSSNPFSEDII